MNISKKVLYQSNVILKNVVRSSTIRQFTSAPHSVDLAGMYPPIPTPFTENHDIHWDNLKSNLAIWSHIPFRGYVVQGSNGEFVFLSHKERVDMIKFVRQNITEDKLIIAGSGCEGTRETIELTKRMAGVGADVAIVAMPSFFKSRMTVTAMLEHFTAVANASPIPVLLYNLPLGNSGVMVPLEAIHQLARHPNIQGIKDSGGNITYIAQLTHNTRHENFNLLAGSAGFLMPAMQLEQDQYL